VISKVQRSCLSFLLIAFIAAPAGAQLLDRTDESQSQQGALEETRAESKTRRTAAAPAPAKKRTDKRPTLEQEQISAQSPSQDPPRWIARAQLPSDSGEESPRAQQRNPLLVLFLWLLAVGLLLFVAERARSWISTNIPLRRLLSGLVFGLRIAAFCLLLAIVFELVPSDQSWMLWTLAVLALVIGWSVRELFADLVAGTILAVERRVKKGMWVSGDGFQGTVEGRTLRATWLRDGQGHRLTVPNRAMVGAPMVYDAGSEAEHEVVVRLEGYEDAGKVRMALTDAILSSPWVLAGATPVVLRDPADPVVWRVRMKLLEPRFSLHFEGELLERVEDLLRYDPRPEEHETVPSEELVEG